MTSGNPRLRVLIIGCGAAARIHSRALSRMPAIELHYASRDGLRAEAYRRKFGGYGAYASYEMAMARDVDVVVVATPTSSHRELALMALNAGKSVVVEKPAFMHAADADDVSDVADKLGLRAYVAENYVYKPLAIHLRRLIGNGDLGEVRFVSLNATKKQPGGGWRDDPALAGGGALFEGGVHWVSFAGNIGLDIEAAYGYRTGGANSSLVVFRYASGAVGTLAYSWEIAAPFGHLRLSKVQGTHGAATFESNGFALVTTGRNASVKLFGRDPLGYGGMWVDFVGALRAGVEPRFTLAMARRDLQLLEQAGAAGAELTGMENAPILRRQPAIPAPLSEISQCTSIAPSLRSPVANSSSG
jgi:predicted dehydrogenase